MTIATEEIVGRLVERVVGQYFGKYRGHVTDNDDPDNLGRIKAKVPRLLGEKETGWALPAFCYGGASEQGLFAVPDIDAGVWIEFEGGDLSYPIWTGTWHKSGTIPESAKPGKKVFKTKSGHKIVLDDDERSIEITDANDNSITMKEGDVRVVAQAKVVVEAPQIEITDGAAHALVFGDVLESYFQQLLTTFNTHVHPIGVPTTGPPIPQLVAPIGLTSTRAKTG